MSSKGDDCSLLHTYMTLNSLCDLKIWTPHRKVISCSPFESQKTCLTTKSLSSCLAGTWVLSQDSTLLKICTDDDKAYYGWVKHYEYQ